MIPVTQQVLDQEALVPAATAALEGGARLAMASVVDHGDDTGDVVYSFLTPGAGAHELLVPITYADSWVPTLAAVSYPAGRFEREIRDLFGVVPRGHPLPHRLVRHGHWPTGYHPMQRRELASPDFAADTGSYPFIEVEGDGVYEIPVGPIHAGMIEPGHFRFFVVGETILRMKARLWFVHRGVEKLFEGRAPEAGIALAERISGDTAVGHAVAYAAAVESALGLAVDARAQATRSLLLELERLHNHVSDIGAIINDVGYGVIHTHCSALREQLLRHHKHVTGHRLLRGGVWVGGAGLRGDVDLALLRSVGESLRESVEIALGNHIAMDRFEGTSVLPTEQARHIGALGYVARASGIRVDARADHPLTDAVTIEPVVETGGDVLARLMVRVREAAQSIALVEELWPLVSGASGGGVGGGEAGAARDGFGLSAVEGWRGTICHRVEVEGGQLKRVKVVDPSFFNWPGLPIALRETIVPDFPLTNKSFNQSYAGNDL